MTKMNDADRIINALERCKRRECDDCIEKNASHSPLGCAVYEDIISDAVESLKKYKADAEYRKSKRPRRDATKLDDTTCPSCGNVV